jgi:hypothetical protein
MPRRLELSELSADNRRDWGSRPFVNAEGVPITEGNVMLQSLADPDTHEPLPTTRGELFHLLFDTETGEPARDEQGNLVYIAVEPAPRRAAHLGVGRRGSRQALVRLLSAPPSALARRLWKQRWASLRATHSAVCTAVSRSSVNVLYQARVLAVLAFARPAL